MKIAVILGTRPEIIKMSPVIRECERRGVDFEVVHRGQQREHVGEMVGFERGWEKPEGCNR